MFDRIPIAIKGKLWKHQAEAIDFAVRHLNATNSPSLIRMPTGTGKTGVIACLTMASNEGSSLVLTPWAHLRDQMVADLANGFWKKIGAPPIDVDVIPILPTTAKDLVRASNRAVFVATFATLNDLRRNRRADYDDLAAAIALVIVDEGHYEPAVEWGKSVKGLKTRTLLLTATPYRNDLKLFRISDPANHVHHFTHEDAVANKIIRDVSFAPFCSSTAIDTARAALALAVDRQETVNAGVIAPRWASWMRFLPIHVRTYG